MAMFTQELIQTISDWQRGGSAKQKAKRAAALKIEAEKLPADFKQVPGPCYRQIALDGSHLMHMGTHFRLSESTSSWTQSEGVAREFKGGVPPPGDYQGVIFSITPDQDSVILNLTSLFENKDFVATVEKNKGNIQAFGDGMGRYGKSQEEVILELDELPLDALIAWGGFSSPEHRLAKMYFGQEPNGVQIQEFRVLMKKAGHIIGPYWLFTKDAVERISEKLKLHAEQLSKANKRT